MRVHLLPLLSVTPLEFINILWNKNKYHEQYFTCTIFNLKLSIGDGSLQGDATTNAMTYKINIQEGTDSTLIIPDDLKSYTGRALISFDTETEKNKILVKGNVKKEDTDMILLYTNLDTLVELTKRLPIAMDIQKE
jgi:hypothetical protein